MAKDNYSGGSGASEGASAASPSLNVNQLLTKNARLEQELAAVSAQLADALSGGYAVVTRMPKENVPAGTRIGVFIPEKVFDINRSETLIRSHKTSWEKL